MPQQLKTLVPSTGRGGVPGHVNVSQPVKSSYPSPDPHSIPHAVRSMFIIYSQINFCLSQLATPSLSKPGVLTLPNDTSLLICFASPYHC